jgi:hypothetical protein
MRVLTFLKDFQNSFRVGGIRAYRGERFDHSFLPVNLIV